MNITGNKVLLRAIEEDDLPLLHKWSNDPVLQDSIGDIHFPSSFEFHKEWFIKSQKDILNQRFAIETPENGLIGLSTIINIDWKNNHAWHGIFIGDKNIKGKNYGTDAVMTTMRYAFDELHLKRLDGSMIEYNLISISMYCNKLGWKQEGIKENYYYRKGKYWSQIIVGIKKEDYYNLIKSNNYWGCK